MGKLYDSIDDDLAQWISEQKLFFVASAPLAAEGHVNCSPKGLDCLRVLGPRTVAYIDLTGSGAETIAHLRENGRVVFMFCAFDGPPKIVRLYGRGEAVTPDDPRWNTLAAQLPTLPGARSIIRVEVDRISDSCGYGVPKYTHTEDRRTLTNWAEKKDPAEIAEYQREKNTTSIDGLPALGGD